MLILLFHQVPTTMVVSLKKVSKQLKHMYMLQLNIRFN
jgi:hypothetical protein